MINLKYNKKTDSYITFERNLFPQLQTYRHKNKSVTFFKFYFFWGSNFRWNLRLGLSMMVFKYIMYNKMNVINFFNIFPFVMSIHVLLLNNYPIQRTGVHTHTYVYLTLNMIYLYYRNYLSPVIFITRPTKG